MLRFIDLTKCDPDEFDDHDFAFFDTVTNRFVLLCGEQVWNSIEEFVVDYNNDIDEPRKETVWPLERFLSLMPDTN